MNLNFKPLGDRVLIQPTENKEKKSKGGIILTDSILKGQKVYGDVVAIGTGIFSQSGEVIPMTVKVGDRVMYTNAKNIYIYDQSEESTGVYFETLKNQSKYVWKDEHKCLTKQKNLDIIEVVERLTYDERLKYIKQKSKT